MQKIPCKFFYSKLNFSKKAIQSRFLVNFRNFTHVIPYTINIILNPYIMLEINFRGCKKNFLYSGAGSASVAADVRVAEN